MKATSEQSGHGSLFRLNVPPKQAFAHPQWRQARSDALRALQTGKSVVLAGPSGTGKTLLLQNLAQTLREEGLSVQLAEPGDLSNEGKEREILLVDEAGSMPTEELANFCKRNHPVLLAALPDFAEQLAKVDCAFVPVALEPLPPGEVAHYVAASLAAAGQPADLLEPGAIQALSDRSHGLLRVVNAVGGGAVFLAAMEGAAHVTERHVEEADVLRHGMVPQPSPAGVLPNQTATSPKTEIKSSPAREALAEVEVCIGTGAFILPVEPCSPQPIASAQQEQGGPSSARAPKKAEVPNAPTTAAAAVKALPRPAPRADATVRFTSSLSAARGQSTGRRRAKLVDSLAASLVVALLGGLALLKPAPLIWQAPQDGARAKLTPDASRTFDTAMAPPPAPYPVPATSDAPAVPDDDVPLPPELPAPRQGRTLSSQPGSRTPASPVLPRPARNTWQADVDGIFTFRGTVFNETMHQGGRLTLTVRQGPNRAVSIRFEASNGLIGSGELVGSLAPDGRVTASGTLMMGRNPHDCELIGVITDTSLTGAATFHRGTSTFRTRSTFSLTRA